MYYFSGEKSRKLSYFMYLYRGPVAFYGVHRRLVTASEPQEAIIKF
jgi:hypothetical protein